MEKNVGFNIIDSRDWESVIEIVPHKEAQKHINQWKHEYDLMIITCVPLGAEATYLSVMRRSRV